MSVYLTTAVGGNFWVAVEKLDDVVLAFDCCLGNGGSLRAACFGFGLRCCAGWPDVGAAGRRLARCGEQDFPARCRPADLEFLKNGFVEVFQLFYTILILNYTN